LQAPAKKKIIIIGPAYPYRGGPSTFVSYIYASLKEKFDITVYNYKLLYPEFLFPGTTQYDESKDLKFIVPSERIVNSINPFNWISTAGKIRKEKADLVIFDWWHPFFGPCHFTISLLIKNKYKNRILFITENYISHEQNKIDRILTSIGLSNASSFIALSNTVEAELKRNFPDRKIYRSELPSFNLYSENRSFDKESCRKELGLKEEERVLLFFGYVRKYKGLDILLNALPLVLQTLPGTKLLIAGEFYDPVDNYKALITQLKLEDNVLLVNKFISNEEVGKYYTAADLNILPYRSATQSAVLNVSYSFKRPVVAADVGGLSEFIRNKETGIIVQPDSAEALANGIIEFFRLRKEINFEENIEKMINENSFNEFPQLIGKIIKESG
jgi:glycosyltransferase involved in cell wall biosynthesis